MWQRKIGHMTTVSYLHEQTTPIECSSFYHPWIYLSTIPLVYDHSVVKQPTQRLVKSVIFFSPLYFSLLLCILVSIRGCILSKYLKLICIFHYICVRTLLTEFFRRNFWIVACLRGYIDLLKVWFIYSCVSRDHCLIKCTYIHVSGWLSQHMIIC